MIEFINVSKVYNNGTEALHDVNLKVPKGEFVFIVGSSGAGKSTFLKLITCEERPSSGKILIDGQDVSRLRKGKIPYVRRKMGMVFQDFRLIDHMTVYDNVAFAMRVVGASGKSIRKRVPYMLSLVGLQHKAKHYPTELSGGERQRVGLARALVNNPEMIIADEPTGNIDPALSFEIVDLLSEINRRGTTILMVTHEHSLVKHFHKRIIQIHSGEIVADTNDMTESYAPPEDYAHQQDGDYEEQDDYQEYDNQEERYDDLPEPETAQPQPPTQEQLAAQIRLAQAQAQARQVQGAQPPQAPPISQTQTIPVSQTQTLSHEQLLEMARARAASGQEPSQPLTHEQLLEMARARAAQVDESDQAPSQEYEDYSEYDDYADDHYWGPEPSSYSEEPSLLEMLEEPAGDGDDGVVNIDDAEDLPPEVLRRKRRER